MRKHLALCDKCGYPLFYSATWDAKYCRACNQWKEAKCSNVNINDYENHIIKCFVECWNRPEFPNEEPCKMSIVSDPNRIFF